MICRFVECLLDLAVRLEAEKIARSSLASRRRPTVLSSCDMPDSISSSSQNTVSSASSTTVPSFAINSARERARQTARQLAATDVPDLRICCASTRASSVLGSWVESLMILSANAFVLFAKSCVGPKSFIVNRSSDRQIPYFPST